MFTQQSLKSFKEVALHISNWQFAGANMSVVPNCEFCKIVNGDSPDTRVEFDNERIVIFADHKPASDYHYLAVPKMHIDDARKLTINDKDLGKISMMVFFCYFCFVW